MPTSTQLSQRASHRQPDRSRCTLRRIGMKRFAWLVAFLAFAPGAISAGEKKGAPKNILLITESKGFRHGCVARKVSVDKDADTEKLSKIDGVRVQVNKTKDK